MMDASKTYTNDTLTTRRKPAAKSLFISTPPNLSIFKNFNSLYISTFRPFRMRKAGLRTLC